VIIVRSSTPPPLESTSSRHAGRHRVEQALLLEAREHVAREAERPLVAVVAGVVADEVAEARLEVRALHEGEGVVGGLHLLDQRGGVEAGRAAVVLESSVAKTSCRCVSSARPKVRAFCIAAKSSSGIFAPVWWCAREDVEHLARPGPLLEHLRRRLDEVAHRVGARVARELGAREQVVEHVAELVEEGHHLLVLRSAPRRRAWGSCTPARPSGVR
jgi:hypothetical protein